MPDPSEHSKRVDDFVEARWRDVKNDLNGDTVTEREAKLARGIIRAIGYLREDSITWRDDHVQREHQSAWARWAKGKLEPAEIIILGTVAAAIAGIFA